MDSAKSNGIFAIYVGLIMLLSSMLPLSLDVTCYTALQARFGRSFRFGHKPLTNRLGAAAPLTPCEVGSLSVAANRQWAGEAWISS